MRKKKRPARPASAHHNHMMDTYHNLFLLVAALFIIGWVIVTKGKPTQTSHFLEDEREVQAMSRKMLQVN